jgi:hypothetical protein
MKYPMREDKTMGKQTSSSSNETKSGNEINSVQKTPDMSKDIHIKSTSNKSLELAHTPDADANKSTIVDLDRDEFFSEIQYKINEHKRNVPKSESEELLQEDKNHVLSNSYESFVMEDPLDIISRERTVVSKRPQATPSSPQVTMPHHNQNALNRDLTAGMQERTVVSRPPQPQHYPAQSAINPDHEENDPEIIDSRAFQQSVDSEGSLSEIGAVRSYETLPSLIQYGSQNPYWGEASSGEMKLVVRKQQFDLIIDMLSREGIGKREEIREELRKITSKMFQLIQGVDEVIDQSLIVDEQEAVWEQLCAHVELYKDFLYQLLSDLENWDLLYDVCPNLLCRAPREKGQRTCRVCQSEYFLNCRHCKNQTTFFADRCQQIQCGKPIPDEDKLFTVAKITNIYAQRQGKASVAAAAAFVLFYLMDRFGMPQSREWSYQIERYRKIQGKVNREYQKRCLQSYSDELQVILSPAFDQVRHNILCQVAYLFDENRFLDALETLNMLPKMLHNSQIEDVRLWIYEKLTEGELDLSEELLEDGEPERALQSLEKMTLDSKRRQNLLQMAKNLIADKQNSRFSNLWQSTGNVLFLLLLSIGSLFHWQAMPAYLEKESFIWITPYALLLISGGWLLREKIAVEGNEQWLKRQHLAINSIFGGVLFFLFGLLLCSWFFTPIGYKFAPITARTLSLYESWRVIFSVSFIGGLIGIIVGGIFGVIIGRNTTRLPKMFLNAMAGAFGVAFGVMIISAIGMTVGSALSSLIVSKLSAALILMLLALFGGFVGAEIGAKIAADMNMPRVWWGGTIGSVIGSIIGSLFGAGAIYNGTGKMILIHHDIVWTGLCLAIGFLGIGLFLMFLFKWEGRYLTWLRWSCAILLLISSYLG